VQATEHAALDAHLAGLADTITGCVRLDDVVAAARSCSSAATDTVARIALRPPGQRIGLARDAAFSFMYPHLIAAWREAGAQILPFQPLADEAPDASVDAIWLPGGYPELHAGRLAGCERFRDGLHGAAGKGVPVHGECGGYMVLGAGLVDADGTRHRMLGLLGLETSFADRKLHLGYRRARTLAASALGAAGTILRGHEFHYATVVSAPDEALVTLDDARGQPSAETGSRRASVSGTFFHAIDCEP
jgi:cobyrinic acid a,c-diamide synthase